MSNMVCGRCNGTGLCDGCRKYGRKACRENTGWPCCSNCKHERRPGRIDTRG